MTDPFRSSIVSSIPSVKIEVQFLTQEEQKKKKKFSASAVLLDMLKITVNR